MQQAQCNSPDFFAVFDNKHPERRCVDARHIKTFTLPTLDTQLVYINQRLLQSRHCDTAASPSFFGSYPE